MTMNTPTRTVSFDIYDFDGLSDKAKERAVDDFRICNYGTDWSEDVMEDFAAIASLFGVEMERDDIRFSGFSSQGDGASFTGHYTTPRRSYETGTIKSVSDAVKEYAPQDETLHALAEMADKLNAWGAISANIDRQRSHYVHANTMTLDNISGVYEYIDEALENQQTYTAIETQLLGILRALANWLYEQLNAAYDHENSTETISETIRINEYEFYEDGEMYHQS